MKEVLGFYIICIAMNYFGTVLFWIDLSTKEKIKVFIFFQIFLSILFLGCILLVGV